MKSAILFMVTCILMFLLIHVQDVEARNMKGCQCNKTFHGTCHDGRNTCKLICLEDGAKDPSQCDCTVHPFHSSCTCLCRA
ncbi:unnamed protein product [Arabidopsis halleri]